MRLIPCLVAISFASSGIVLAQSGVPTRPEDVAPAAPTGASGPDGGRRYEYPPNTGAILRPENRTPYSGGGEPAPVRPGESNPTPGLSSKPPEQVGK